MLKKSLIAIAMVVLLAVPAMAPPIPLDSDSSPVNLKIMPMAIVTAPAFIDVEITTISASQLGSSSGNDFGTFLISTNLTEVDLDASILSPGLSGGDWQLLLQGQANWSGVASPSTDNIKLYGPIPANTPYDIYVKVSNVDMTSIPFVNAFVWDTQLTVTLSIP